MINLEKLGCGFMVVLVLLSIFAIAFRCSADNSDWELVSTEKVYAVERIPITGSTGGKNSRSYHLYLVILSDGAETSLEPLEWTKVEKGDLFTKKNYHRERNHELKNTIYEYVGKSK